MYAAISPRDNAAGLLHDEDGVVQVLDRAGLPVRSISVARHLSRHPDTLVVDVRDGKHAIEVLAERSTMSMCLDMTLLLFDRDLTFQTRQELAVELNRLFEGTDNRHYVLDVVLSRPLSPSADVDGAVNAAEGANITRDIVASIVNCQDRLRLILESWLLIKQEAIVQQVGVDGVFALLSLHGVFRRLALEAVDTERLDAITHTLVMDANLCAQLDAAPRIVLPLVTELKKRLPVGTVQRPAASGQAHIEVSKSEYHNYDVAKPQHTSVHAAYSAAVSQVDKIADLYARLKDAQAEAILDELIAEQTKHPSGEQQLVKSLCNVAMQVNSRGRPEISLSILMKAIGFPNGIDSQLYIQIGDALADLGQLEQALDCCQHAQKLDDGSLSDRIQLAMIRVTVKRGRYEEALSEYLAIPNLECKPRELSGMGTLYRKMGRPRDARKAYRECLQIDEGFHSAFAGLAEIRKQTGKPHEAIAEYNALVKRFNRLDVGPKKIYDLARSHLFRLTMQYDKSESILRGLVDAFPADRGVHLQFAKLLALRGDFDQAQEHFEKAKGPSLHELGQLLFASATKRCDSTSVRDRLANIQTSLMPEDTGLASCIAAYDLITTSEFDRAQHVLRNTAFVDRLVGDLAAVLRFHSLRKASSSFNYKSDHCLCRVAKRSDRSLRRTMHLIASGDYDKAEQLEADFLLRVAA